MRYIKSIGKSITTTNNETVPLSVRKRKECMKAYSDFSAKNNA